MVENDGLDDDPILGVPLRSDLYQMGIYNQNRNVVWILLDVANLI